MKTSRQKPRAPLQHDGEREFIPALLRATQPGDELPAGWLFYCPGCRVFHNVDARWEFNGDLNRPTFKPDLLLERTMPDGTKYVCRMGIVAGQIRYANDCTHKMPGMVLDMVRHPALGWGVKR